MSECDAFKLIEEFIKKSSPSPKLTYKKDTTLNSQNVNTFDLPPTLLSITTTSGNSSPSSSASSSSSTASSSSFMSNLISTCDKEQQLLEPKQSTLISNETSHILVIETPPESPEQAKLITLPDKQNDLNLFQKPNRPYSYYVATNFHPLDLTLLSSLENEYTLNESNLYDDSKSKLVGTTTTDSTLVSKNVDKSTSIEYSSNNNRSARARNKTTATSKDDKKRLSMSLSDIKVPSTTTTNKQSSSNKNNMGTLFKFNSKKSKSNQNNLNCTDESSSRSSSFKRSAFFTSTMPARITSKSKANSNSNNNTNVSTQNHHHVSGGKINRFFRQLFRLNHTNENKTVKNDNQYIDQQHETESTNFKFSRLFSFRHSSNQSLNKNVKYKYSLATRESTRESVSTTQRTNSTSTNSTTGPNFQLIVTDEQPSKVLLPQINLNQYASPKSNKENRVNTPECCSSEMTDSYNKMNSLDNLDILKDKFYSEVADRLKKIATYSNYTSSTITSNEKSSLSSIDLIDIPYIDDEEDEQEDNLFSYATSSDYTFNNCSKLKTDMNNLSIDLVKLNDLINNASYSKFDEIAIDYLNKYDSIWYKIAILFELINRAVQMVSLTYKNSDSYSDDLILKLKEIAANYIHDKYCDWIYQNGGWKSVPDIISLPSENNERIH